MNTSVSSKGCVRPESALPAHQGTGHAVGLSHAARPRCDRPTAGASPRLVIRGESFGSPPCHATKEDGEPLAALTDYLNVSFPFTPSQANLVALVRNFRLMLGDAFGAMEQRKGGLHGYAVSFAIGDTGALFAYGGQRDTALVSLPGTACVQIEDWQAVCRLFGEDMGGRITRWDGAVDVFDGSPSVDDAVAFYKQGLFNAGGNKPSCGQQGNWIEPDGTGRTFYVGKRKNGKLLRVYEKGKQLGAPESPWVRWELELHNQDRVIPWGVVLGPGKYVAAAYPVLGWVSQTQERIRTLKRSTRISYEHLARYAKIAYGPLISVMLEVEGSPEKVVERLKREGVPARLDCGGLPPAPLLADGGQPAAT